MTDITLRDALGDDLWKLQLAKLSRYECSLGKDETLSDLVSARYQDVDHTTDVETATLVTHDALSYSDYSGGTVERSNVRVLRESGDAANTGGGAEEERSVYLIAHGFHDTTALYFKLDEPMPEEHARSIASALLALTDYPCADEGDLSELEHETGEEAWESYGRQDFMNDLQSRVDRMEDCLTVDDCDAIDRAFPALANATNACGGPGYEFEQGGGVRFDNDRVLSAPVLAFAALGLLRLADDAVKPYMTPEDHDLLRGAHYLLGAGQALRVVADRCSINAHALARVRVLDGTVFDLDVGLSVESWANESERRVRVALPGPWDADRQLHTWRTFTIDPANPTQYTEGETLLSTHYSRIVPPAEVSK
jgi:hypothetical protein